MDTKIFHRINKQVDLIAKDFDQPFIVRKFCGSAAINLYATLRATGHDAKSSFLAAFGMQFFGHPDAIAHAAECFETTSLYRSAAEDAIEMLGAERITKELSDRCHEASQFTHDHAMKFRVEMHQEWYGSLKFETEQAIHHRDDAAFAEFDKERRTSREKAARQSLVGNGIGSSIWTERIGGNDHE